jgi:DNA-binding protein H-NS
MAKVNLSGMDVASLMELRTKIDDALSGQRSILEKQLQALGGSIGSPGRARKSLKGKKVAPKYRGPEGETWAGRGASPRWLVEAIKGGKKREDFLIDQAGAKPKRKTRVARRRTKR